MPHVDACPLALPFQGSEPLARHCSHQGAVQAAERAGRQAVAILALYAAQGPLTDAEVAEALGIQRSSVNARRAALMKLRLVRSWGTKQNPATGITNTTYGLITGA